MAPTQERSAQRSSNISSNQRITEKSARPKLDEKIQDTFDGKKVIYKQPMRFDSKAPSSGLNTA